MSLIKAAKTWYQVVTDDHRQITTSGTGLVKQYTPRYDEKGLVQLVETGESDLYAEIQSYAASTDLALIMSRYFNGEPEALSRVQGAYMDISNMPSNIHEAMSLMENARKDFETLPVDIKEKFGNDANQFLATLGTEQWFDAMQVKRDDMKESADSGEQE